MEGKVVFENNEIIIRYPQKDDLGEMIGYINTLSLERTFIRFQGEQVTISEEKQYLDNVLSKISDKKEVMLLVFARDKLVGNSSIEMFDKTERHRGLLGISVAKEYRGKGIGKLLINKVFEEAKKELANLKIVTLSVSPINFLAQNLYKKFGFIEYGKLPNGIFRNNKYEDEILMHKEI